jgi:hypothetical protein
MNSDHIINKRSMKLLLIINIQRVPLKLFIDIVPSEFLRKKHARRQNVYDLNPHLRLRSDKYVTTSPT